MGLEFDPKEAILHHEEGVDLIPSNKLLAGMDMSLFTVEDREKSIVLKKKNRYSMRSGTGLTNRSHVREAVSRLHIKIMPKTVSFSIGKPRIVCVRAVARQRHTVMARITCSCL